MSGTPISLLRFPSVLSVRPRLARIAAIISRVVVLPFEPVTATTGRSKRSLWKRAIDPSAGSVSGTARSGIGGEASAAARSAETTAAAAPACAAAAT